MVSVVPDGEVAYKAANNREVTASDVALEAASILPVGKIATVGKTTVKGASIWTKGGKLSGVENALGHWKKHGNEFPEFQNAKQYVDGAKDFFKNSPSGTLMKIRPDGDVLKYHQKTNTFGVMDATGVPRTMFRPTDGIKYWNIQK